ncbi:MAG: hypothetical protein ABIL58_19920 [Pseudomonadota bacterium]
MGSTILFNTAGNLSLAINYEIMGPSELSFISYVDPATVRLEAEAWFRVGDAVISVPDDVDITAADLDAGVAFGNLTQYLIYACHPIDGTLQPVFVVSENATFPAGWNGTNSRKIGGFTTNGSGEIVEASLWDLRTLSLDGMATVADIVFTDDGTNIEPVNAGRTLVLDGGITVGGNITMGGDDTWIGFAAGGRIVLDSTPATDTLTFSDCDVGIGITPISPLHVSDTTNDGTALAVFSQLGTGRGIEVNRNVGTATRPLVSISQTSATGGSQTALLVRQADTGETAIGVNTDGSLTAFNFSVKDTGLVYATSIGIGTSNPAAKLHIAPITWDVSQNGGIILSATDLSHFVYGLKLKSDAVGNSRFSIDTPSINDALVVHSLGNVGIGETSPDEMLHLTSATSAKPVIKIENTEAGAGTGALDFYKTSTSPADNDLLGTMSFYGLNSSISTHARYVRIEGYSGDVTSGDESGGLKIKILMDGTEREVFNVYGYNGNVNQGGVVWNENAQDIDQRWEAVGQANALFVQGSEGLIGIGTNTPQVDLDILKLKSGGIVSQRISNSSNTTDSYARLSLAVAGATAADPFIVLTVDGAESYSIGIDNSDSDKFKISDNTTLGINDRLVIDSVGVVSLTAVYAHDMNGETIRDLQINDSGELGYDSSTIRHKMNVVTVDDTEASFIQKLRPVIYNPRMKGPYGHTDMPVDMKRWGLIAEEVNELVPEFVYKDDDGLPCGIHYKDFIPAMIHEIQRLSTELATLNAAIH